MIRRSLLAVAAAAALAACTGTTPRLPPPASPPGPAGDLPPLPPREFRAAWVATVANIDWPSKPGLAAEAQRAEALAILERARAIGLNALVFQVRPAGDAVYPSALEPWTEYLSGEQGRPPYANGEAPWDPLAFWIAEAHRRGLELHAWLNPFRARHSGAKSPLVAPHLGVRQPALVKRYGDMAWMDPGEPAAAAHTLAVVADIVRRYDVDGIHIDDYFYPYPLPVEGAPEGTDQPFPDDQSWARYQLEGGTLQRDDWRRANVDKLVQAMHTTVHSIKPWVSFGVSPFGIGKPERRPSGITGFSQYDKLYADVEKWLANGWLDYLVPQLYWPIDRVGQQYPVLLDYWLAENTSQRHVYAGLFTSLVTRGEPLGRRVWPAREIVEQVALQRSRAAAGGHVHFSMIALMQDRDGVATLLQNGPYAKPALVPATPWRQATPPAAPRLRASGGRVLIDAAPAAANDVATWALWRRLDRAWHFAVLPAHERSIAPAGADTLVVAAVGRTGVLSERSLLRLS